MESAVGLGQPSRALLTLTLVSPASVLTHRSGAITLRTLLPENNLCQGKKLSHHVILFCVHICGHNMTRSVNSRPFLQTSPKGLDEYKTGTT